jgi:hypothetical protein
VGQLATITAILLVVSGGMKLRSSRRLGLGIGLMPVVELVFGLLIGMAGLAAAVGSFPLPRWSIPVAVLLVLVSTGHHASRLSERRRSRAETEGGRLASHVRYFSGDDDST